VLRGDCCRCSDEASRRRVPVDRLELGFVICADERSDDAARLAGALAGDRDALSRLLAAHYDRCYAVSRRILSNEEDALDATQDAMIAIARGLARFDGRSSFSTWCYRVATNAALDELRRRKRRPLAASDRLMAEAGSDSVLAAATDRVAGPVTDRLLMERALAQLPEDQRVAVVLRDIADLDYSEIVSVLGIPIGTVRSRIFRGRAALAEMLRPRREPGDAVTRSQRNATPPAPVETDETTP
jgi:RNA polymerase sigma-70 factor (ECF subfamily)